MDEPQSNRSFIAKENTMAENNKTDSNSDKHPTHTLFINQRFDGNLIRVKAGVAWKHSKGDGFNISLNDMVAFENKEEPATTKAEKKASPKP